jgi:Ca-activated chloride channel family protein
MKPRPASHPPLCTATNGAFKSAGSGASAEDTAITYVSVPVHVTDGEGRPVVGLDGSHFRIYEDDAAQVVDRVEPPGASVNVALLLDSSSSMRRKADQSRAAIAAGLNVFSGLGGPVVVSFDRRVVLYSKPSADLMRFGESTGQPPVGLWATRLYDALDLVLTRVLVPEGAGDPGPVHARAADFLRQIVDITGGRLLVAPALDAIENAFAGIARELSEQYLVAYYPTNQNRDGTYRRIRIEVNKPGVTVRARAGYYQASTARTP